MSLKAWWSGLAARERVMVGGGSVFVILAFFYLAVHEPLSIRVDDLREQLVIEQEVLAELEVLAARADDLGDDDADRPAPPDKSPVVFVTTTAAAHGLKRALGRTTPTEGGVSVSFKGAVFDDLVAWLAEIAARNAVVVERINLNRDEAAVGRVSGNLTLVLAY